MLTDPENVNEHSRQWKGIKGAFSYCTDTNGNRVTVRGVIIFNYRNDDRVLSTLGRYGDQQESIINYRTLITKEKGTRHAY